MVSPPPHIESPITTSGIMAKVIIALLPAVIASGVIFGLRSFLLIAVCVSSCVLFEYLFCKVSKKGSTIGDLSAVVTGLLLAFNLPSTLPFYMAVIGSATAIIVAKCIFGGLGQNFANPALVGRLVLFVSFSSFMGSYPDPIIGGISTDAVSGATPLAAIASGGGQGLSIFDLLLGIKGGVLGEVCAIALIIGGCYLIFTKIISPIIPLVYIATVFALTFIAGASPVEQVFSGGLILGAFFMATDYATSPITKKGKFIFALGCGIITVAIRLYGSYPEGVSFAILLMNILSPLIDRITKTKAAG